MQNRKLLTVILAVIVVLVGSAIAFNLAARSPAAGQVTGAPISGTPAPSTTPASGSQVATASSLSVAPIQSESATQAPTESDKGNAPARSTPSASVEVPSVSATAVEKPKLEVPAAIEPSATTLPKSVERTPALTGKAPPAGTAKGKLVEGFPTKALPIPEGAHIVDSSVSTQNRNVQAAANFRTSLSQEKVLTFYEAQAAKKGWLATRGKSVDGAATVTVGYANDTVVATVRTAATGATTVAVFGSFKVGK